MRINCEVRYPSHQDDAKHYDTAKLREHYLVKNLMVPDEINMVYSMFDRIIAGGAVPVKEELILTPPEILRSEYFTQRREIGIINVGGSTSAAATVMSLSVASILRPRLTSTSIPLSPIARQL